MRGSLVCRKVTHPSRGKADAHLRALRRREEAEGRDPIALTSYYCWRCRGWHVGHRKDLVLAPDADHGHTHSSSPDPSA